MYLESQYNLNPDKIGYIMCFAPLGYFLGIIIISNINKHRKIVFIYLFIVKFYKLIFMGCLVEGLACFYMGPDKGITGV